LDLLRRFVPADCHRGAGWAIDGPPALSIRAKTSVISGAFIAGDNLSIWCCIWLYLARTGVVTGLGARLTAIALVGYVDFVSAYTIVDGEG
jgi:hypothetical protein